MSAQEHRRDSGFWWGSSVEGFASNGDLYFTGSIGYQWDDWRLFAEAGYVASETGFSGFVLETRLVPVTLNLSYEWELTERLVTFSGAGGGVAWIGSEVETPFFSVDESEVTWAGQVFVGVSYEIWESVWIDGLVRYLAVGDFEVGGVPIDSSEDLTIGLGLRLNF